MTTHKKIIAKLDYGQICTDYTKIAHPTSSGIRAQILRPDVLTVISKAAQRNIRLNESIIFKPT